LLIFVGAKIFLHCLDMSAAGNTIIFGLLGVFHAKMHSPSIFLCTYFIQTLKLKSKLRCQIVIENIGWVCAVHAKSHKFAWINWHKIEDQNNEIVCEENLSNVILLNVGKPNSDPPYLCTIFRNL
jgi:hypothetical protein